MEEILKRFCREFPFLKDYSENFLGKSLEKLFGKSIGRIPGEVLEGIGQNPGILLWEEC